MATTKPAVKAATKWQKLWNGVKKFFVWIWVNIVTMLLVIALVIGIHTLLIFLRTLTSTQSGYIVPETPIVSEQVQKLVVVEEQVQEPAGTPEPIVVQEQVQGSLGNLEAPDQRSAASNDNFIGYFGSRGKGWTIPTQVLDTNGKVRSVGSVLYTWCLTEKECFYSILQPGEIISEGHQGSQINIYSPQYVGLEANELQFIQTHQQTRWTVVK